MTIEYRLRLALAWIAIAFGATAFGFCGMNTILYRDATNLLMALQGLTVLAMGHYGIHRLRGNTE